MDNECKDRIIEVSAELFKKYGIRAVTMDTLAGEMGISKRTIYEKFEDKDALLHEVVLWMGRQQIRAVETLMNESETVIHAIFELINLINIHMSQINPVFFEDLKKYHHSVNKRLMGKRFDKDLTMSKNIISQGVEQGLFRDNINQELINHSLHGVFRLTGDFDLFPREEFTRHDVVRGLLLNYLRGISTSRGIRIIDVCELEMNSKG